MADMGTSKEEEVPVGGLLRGFVEARGHKLSLGKRNLGNRETIRERDLGTAELCGRGTGASSWAESRSAYLDKGSS